jgi:hypothetical protein
VGDTSKSLFFRKINKFIRKRINEGLSYDQALKSSDVEPLISIFNKDFSKAEKIYI